MGQCFSCNSVDITQEIYDETLVKELFPILNDVDTFSSYIRYAKDNNHVKKIKNLLIEKGFVENDKLTISTKPFNVFARFGSETVNNPVSQSLIFDQRYWMVCHNLYENDLNWYNPNFPSASMAGPDKDGNPGHVFITTKLLNWKNFNVTTIALEVNGLNFLNSLKEVAVRYSKGRGWKNTGYYFHCFPYNSVNSLHLHVINLDNVGFNFVENNYKNITIDDVINAVEIVKSDNV
jgi:hypothetical protein